MDTQPSHIPPYYDIEDELTLKDIIKSTKEYLSHFWENKLWILALSCLGIVLGVAFTKFTPITFESAISFIVDESSSEGIALEAKGIDNVGYQEEKLVTLSKSDKIVRNIIFKKVVIDGVDDLFINHLCKIYGIEDSDGNIQQFNSTSTDDLNDAQLNVVGRIQEIIVGNPLSEGKGLMNIDIDRSKLITMSVISGNSDLTQSLVDNLYQSLRTFYVDQTIGRVKGTRDLLLEREKEILNELGAAEDELNREISKAELNATQESEKVTSILQRLENTDRILAINQEEKQQAIARAETSFKIRQAELEFELSLTKAELEKIRFDTEEKEKNQEKERIKQDLENTLAIESLKNELDLATIDKSFAQANLNVFTDINQIKKIPQYQGIQGELIRLNKEFSVAKNLISNAIKEAEQKMSEGESYSFLDNIEVLESDFSSKRVQMNSLLNQLNAAIDSVNRSDPSLDYDMSKVVSDTRNYLDTEMKKTNDLSGKIIDLNFDRLSRKVKDTYSIYQDILKNRQVLDLQLKTLTPEFAIITRTYSPKENKPSLITNITLGAFLGLFLGLGFFLFQKLVKDAL